MCGDLERQAMKELVFYSKLDSGRSFHSVGEELAIVSLLLVENQDFIVLSSSAATDLIAPEIPYSIGSTLTARVAEKLPLLSRM